MSDLGKMTYNLSVQQKNIDTAEAEINTLRKEKGIIETEREEVGPHWTSPGAQETLAKLDNFFADDLVRLEEVFISTRALLDYIRRQTAKIDRTGQYT